MLQRGIGLVQSEAPPGDFPNPGIELESPAGPALVDTFFTTEPSGKPHIQLRNISMLALCSGTGSPALGLCSP